MVKRPIPAIVLLLVLAGCADSAPSGGSIADAPAVAPANSTQSPAIDPAVPAESTPSPTVSQTSAEASSDVTTSAGDDSTPGATSSGVPKITVGEGQSRDLVLADAAVTGDWREGSRVVAGQSQERQAMWLSLPCYGGDDRSRTVEYRFAETQGVLSVDVAQDMNADASSDIVEFTMYADDRLVDTKAIKFKEQKTLTTKLAGVVTVKILATQATESCDVGTTALITQVSVKG